MRHLFLMVISLLLLVSCSKNKEPEPAATADDGSWNSFVDYMKSDPLQGYTQIVYKHSIEHIAVVSPGVANKCGFGVEGMTKLDLKALLEFDYNRGRECWNGLINYPKADHRFSVVGTPEYESWRAFWERRDDYTPLFQMF